PTHHRLDSFPTRRSSDLQRGWGDLYDSTLDGQWIDISGVADGNYTLELEVNPQHILPESDYSNNITRVPVTIGAVAPANNNFAKDRKSTRLNSSHLGISY